MFNKINQRIFTVFLALLFAGTINAQTARLQVIHNSPDPAAATVDIYLWNTV